MAKKNKNRQKSKASVQTTSPEQTHNKSISQPSDLSCEIFWSYLFKETFERHTETIITDLDTLYNQVNAQNDTSLCKNFTAFQNQVKGQLHFFMENYNNFVMPEHIKVLQEKQNLIDVKKKIK